MKIKLKCAEAFWRTLSKFFLIMKLTIILLIIGLTQVSARTYGQLITLHEKNTSIQSVFNTIEDKTGYHFIYDDKLDAFFKAKTVNIDVESQPIEDVLNQCLKGVPVNYMVIQKTIALKETGQLQNEKTVVPIQKISGIVTDETGKTLPGATVTNKNTTITVATDANGFFSINASEGDVLAVSFVGYQRAEYKVTQSDIASSTTRLAIKLQQGNSSLSDVVVVAVGYGTLDKKEVTSAITHLSAKDLNTVAGNGVLNSIQGKVSGLSITNTATADPNSGPSVQLRGVSSRSAGTGPLYVINGIPGGNIDNLNQNDIESIDVLKGGAASAIYGTRGSNGVIIITTKKGTGEAKGFYDGYYSSDIPTNEIKVLTRDQFLEHNRGVDYGGNTDWVRAVRRNFGYQQKHTLQFSGASGRNSYNVSFDYRDADGLDLRSTKKEYGTRINLAHNSADGLYSVSVNVAPRHLDYNNASYSAFSQGITLNPTIPIKDTANSSRYYYINTGFPGSYNPVEELKTALSGGEGKYLDWSSSFKLNAAKNLYTQVTVGQQTYDFFNFYFLPSYNTAAVYGNSGQNIASRAYNSSDQKSLEWIGNYTLNVKEHTFKLLGGYSYFYSVNSGLSASNQNFPSDVLTYNNLGSGVSNYPVNAGGATSLGSYKNDATLIAFFGRLNYDFDKRFYLSASLRHEGSSKFGFDNKWGNFPAGSFGWIISNEQFFPVLSWLNELKLRADYGVTGNQDFASYLSLDTYSGYGHYSYDGVQYQVWGPSQNTNYKLKWETAHNFNVGLDFELFNNKVSGSLNYYIRRTNDLLGYYFVQTPPNIQGTTFANVGSMENNGLEIQLKGTPVRNKNFVWNVSFAGASNKNNFVSFSNNIYHGQSYIDMVYMPSPGSPGSAQRLQEGRSIGSFYMLRSAGVDATGRLLVYNKNGKIIPGNMATTADKQFVGTGLPKITASLGNTFTYKDLDLSVFLRGSFGYKLFNTRAFYAGTPVTQNGSNVLSSAYDGGKYAALTNPETYSTLSDYFLEKGDFVKIDNITLGYNPKLHIKHINGLRIYVTGRNLYTLTKYTGGDPESIDVNGLTPGINSSLTYYPSTLQLIAGFQLKF